MVPVEVGTMPMGFLRRLEREEVMFHTGFFQTREAIGFSFRDWMSDTG